MPEIVSYFQTYGLRTDFDYIQPIGSDINDADIIPAIGEFLLKSKTTLKPDIILYNTEESDKFAIYKIMERVQKCGIKQRNTSGYNNKLAFKYILRRKRNQLFAKHRFNE